MCVINQKLKHMKKEQTIEALNTLIEINNEGIQGYGIALKETKEAYLKTLFFQLLYTAKKCKTELVSEVLQLGGIPMEGTRTNSTFLNIWRDIKEAFTLKDYKKTLGLCEYMEVVTLATYNNVLKNKLQHSNSELQFILGEQHSLLKADHHRVKEMLLRQN